MAAVRWLGQFSSFESDGDHESGYTVDLWKHGGSLIGILTSHVGPVGDSPRGPLKEVTYDPKSGSVAFEAEFTLGRTFNDEHEVVPSRIRLSYKFKGRLSTDAIEGTLEESWTDDGKPLSAHKYETSLFHKTSPMWVSSDYESYDLWWKQREKTMGTYK